MKKYFLFCLMLLLPFTATLAEERGAFFQIVKSEWDLKPEMVKETELIYDELNHSYRLRLTFTSEAEKQMNDFLLNSYGMKLNTLVNNEPVSLSVMILMHELGSNVLDITSDNEAVLKKFQSYLIKK